MPTLTFLVFLWIFLGYISSFVRRLHDLDLSGWWIGIPIILYQSHILGFVFINYNFLAIIGLYILGLVIYCCKKGTDSTNKYGPIQTQSFEFFESIKKCLFSPSIVDFKSRARRSEFWWIVLAYFIINFILSFLDPSFMGQSNMQNYYKGTSY